MPEIIRGWKQIADKLDVSISKAKELEEKEGLPIRRDGQVFVLDSELNKWLLDRPVRTKT